MEIFKINNLANKIVFNTGTNMLNSSTTNKQTEVPPLMINTSNKINTAPKL